jgi:transcriptional regulator
MYLPAHFREDDLPTLQNFIREHPFAIVITQLEGRPVASHIPLTYDSAQGSLGTLYGHFALGNQQRHTFDGSQEALVIFQGPHAYVSSSWYEEPLKAVPTWNYAVVHVYGTPRLLEQEELFQHMTALTGEHEEARETAWTFDEQREHIRKLRPGVSGFALPIARIEGKYKLSQNRPERDREHVIEHLQDLDAERAAVATLMRSRQTREG